MLKSCGYYIKRLRTSLGLTQEEFAEELSVSYKVVSAWEQCRVGVKIEMLNTILDHFKLSWKEFYDNDSADDGINLHIKICGVCENPIISFNDLKVDCCGIEVQPYEWDFDERNNYSVKKENGNIRFSIDHEMNKDHYLSFIIYVHKKGYDLEMLSPDDKPEAVFADKGKGEFIVNCTRLGLQNYKYK